MAAHLGAPRSPAELLFDGDHSLEVQSFRPRELLHGHVNVDGYGVAWYPADRPVRLAEARPLWHDPDLEPLLRTIEASPVLAAVRNVTPGILPDRSGLSPLLHDRWAFVLNGFVESFRSRAMRPLHALLPDDLHGRLRGTSDTEALFLLLVHSAREGGSLVEAVGDVVRTALAVGRDAGSEVQLNLLVSDGRDLVATRMGTGDAQNSLWVSERPGGGRWSLTVASEPLDSVAPWRPVPPSSLVEASEAGGLRIRPIDVG